MDTVQRQARRMFWVLVLTIAWQAFAYGWIVNDFTRRPSWPPPDLGRDFTSFWSSQSIPPAGYLLQKFITYMGHYSNDPAALRSRVEIFASFMFHVLLVSLGLVIAGKQTRTDVAPIMGYALAAWNPFLMSAVARAQWLELAALSTLSMAYLAILRNHSRQMFLWFWLGTLLDPIVFLFWPVPVAVAWSEKNRITRIFLGAFPGIILWGGIAVFMGIRPFLQGWQRWWWEGGNWPDLGWNSFTFLYSTGIQPHAAGWISLVAWFSLGLWLTVAYRKEGISLRILPVLAAAIAWLFFWRSRFLEVGMALYWTTTWAAHKSSFYHDPIITSRDSSTP